MIKRILTSDNASSTILIRLMVGAVFLSEGIQKFTLAPLRGAGRFESIGLPAADILGPLVGGFEVVCGFLILIGLFTRLAAIPTLVIMLVAIAVTKSKVYSEEGFWQLLHGSRTDWAMLLGSLFLIIKGGGLWSLDKIAVRFVKR